MSLEIGAAKSRGKHAVRAVAAAVVLGTAAGAALAQDADQALIERGRYLSTASDCVACHTAPGSSETYAGGYAVQSPMGAIWATNITPSKEFGIGDWSEEEFARAVRDGIAKDGSHLYPAMPYPSYAKITDEDIAALYAYFIHEVAPVDRPNVKTELEFPFSIRTSMAGWNMLFLDRTRFQPDATQSAEWNRGAYLAEGPAHCSTCHTPRNALMGEDASQTYAGGSLGLWYAPNITPHEVAGIGSWSRDELVQYLRSGDLPGKSQAGGAMAEAIEHSFQHLTDDDINAIVTYVQSVPEIGSGETVSRFDYAPPNETESILRGAPGADDPGFRLFSGTCAACHGVNGQGAKDYPSLYNNAVTGADRPDNLIATIVEGVHRNAGGVATMMPGFGPDAYPTESLTDQEIADVSNYVFATFGNPAVKVTADQVTELRNGGPKPLIVRLAPYTPYATVAGVILFLLVIWGALRLTRRRQAA